MNDKMKKFFSVPVIMIVLAVGALAIWILSIQSTSNYTVQSKESNPLMIVAGFTGGVMNTLNQSANTTDVFKFSNSDGPANLIVTIEKVITDNTSDTCTDYENDCIATYFYDKYTEISDQQVLMVSGGNHNITQVLYCEQLSCPQIFAGTVKLDPQ